MNVDKKKNRQTGFTLVELVIAMALTVLLLTGLFTMLSTSLRIWTLGGSKTEIQQTARYGIDMLTRDLQFATQIAVNSETNLDLWTNKYGTANQKISYSLDTSGSTKILRRNMNTGSNAQPITGGGNTPISVDIAFKDLTPSGSTKTIRIWLQTTDLNTKQQFTIDTAVSSMLIQ